MPEAIPIIVNATPFPKASLDTAVSKSRPLPFFIALYRGNGLNVLSATSLIILAGVL